MDNKNRERLYCKKYKYDNTENKKITVKKITVNYFQGRWCTLRTVNCVPINKWGFLKKNTYQDIF